MLYNVLFYHHCTIIMLIYACFYPSLHTYTHIHTHTHTYSVRNPLPELQELFCRQTPGPRAYHGMVMHEDRLYLLGGKQSESLFYGDAWYRGETCLLLFIVLFA